MHLAGSFTVSATVVALDLHKITLEKVGFDLFVRFKALALLNEAWKR